MYTFESKILAVTLRTGVVMEGTVGCFGGQTNKKCILQADSLSPTHNHTYAWMELDQA